MWFAARWRWLLVSVLAIVALVVLYAVLDDGKITRADCFGVTGDRYEICESLGK